MRMALRMALLTTLALLALLFVACGGGDDDDASDADPTQTSQATEGSGDDDEATPDDGDDDDDEETATPDEGDDGDDDDGGDDDGSADYNVCELLTTEEVAAATDSEVLEGKVNSDGPEKPECEWDGANIAQVLAIYVSVYQPGDPDLAESDYEIFDGDAEQLEGLGDRAHWVDSFSLLEILDDGRNVVIQVVDFDADPKAIALELAPKVLERLP